MLKISDREAIIKVKEGEIDYFSHIVKKYFPPIHRYLSLKIFDKDEIDDIIQNAFLSFYKAINRFDENKSVSSYLFQIVKNEMKMYFRSRKKTFKLDEKIAAPDKEHDYTKDDLEKLLNVLPTNQKKALKLLAEGYSYQEIAGKLRKPLNTIKTLIRRARLAVSQNKNEKS